ncbi:hypothetical protein Hypma_014389 [Hypsizygus marmoreus]|uniref:Uncharacterized protein n=1 Tax=Hypsizygus marmoreus TaxID=39966 RepID=A0A369JED6_HYPMA|nr:hypothetical protein Hypma_014389 [Hypsizygus marmoreus]
MSAECVMGFTATLVVTLDEIKLGGCYTPQLGTTEVVCVVRALHDESVTVHYSISWFPPARTRLIYPTLHLNASLIFLAIMHDSHGMHELIVFCRKAATPTTKKPRSAEGK